MNLLESMPERLRSLRDSDRSKIPDLILSQSILEQPGGNYLGSLSSFRRQLDKKGFCSVSYAPKIFTSVFTTIKGLLSQQSDQLQELSGLLRDNLTEVSQIATILCCYPCIVSHQTTDEENKVVEHDWKEMLAQTTKHIFGLPLLSDCRSTTTSEEMMSLEGYINLAQEMERLGLVRVKTRKKGQKAYLTNKFNRFLSS